MQIGSLKRTDLLIGLIPDMIIGKLRLAADKRLVSLAAYCLSTSQPAKVSFCLDFFYHVEYEVRLLVISHKEPLAAQEWGNGKKLRCGHENDVTDSLSRRGRKRGRRLKYPRTNTLATSPPFFLAGI
jgi:hypothetical protein